MIIPVVLGGVGLIALGKNLFWRWQHRYDTRHCDEELVELNRRTTTLKAIKKLSKNNINSFAQWFNIFYGTVKDFDQLINALTSVLS